MTRDAFEKAQELEGKLEAVHRLQDIISNSTLGDEEEFKAHNDHVRDNDMILCYVHKADLVYKKNVELNYHSFYRGKPDIIGDFHMGGFIFGRDVPLDLVKRLERCLWDYEKEIDKEFLELDGNYIDDEEELK
jgi:hypothetical protein